MQQLGIELRALHWLHRLHIALSEEHHGQADRVLLFNVLLSDAFAEVQLQPRVLQWHEFAFHELLFTDQLTPLLLRLPMLQRLAVDLARCTQFAFLTALPQLAHLELHLWYMDGAAWPMLLAVFTSDGLARLHELVLHCGPCSSDDLFLLLSHTPSLTSLVLDELGQMSSLSFFRQLPKLAQTLAHLTVSGRNTQDLIRGDLQSLLVLHQLRVLRLLDWPTPLSVMDRTPFEQRPCAVLTHLEVFEWTPISASSSVFVLLSAAAECRCVLCSPPPLPGLLVVLSPAIDSCAQGMWLHGFSRGAAVQRKQRQRDAGVAVPWTQRLRNRWGRRQLGPVRAGRWRLGQWVWKSGSRRTVYSTVVLVPQCVLSMLSPSCLLCHCRRTFSLCHCWFSSLRAGHVLSFFSFCRPAHRHPVRRRFGATLRFKRHFVPRCADERPGFPVVARTGDGDGGEQRVDSGGAVHAPVHAGLGHFLGRS
jgi:hypothetical protein